MIKRHGYLNLVQEEDGQNYDDFLTRHESKSFRDRYLNTWVQICKTKGDEYFYGKLVKFDNIIEQNNY